MQSLETSLALQSKTAHAIRLDVRAGHFTSHTVGLAPGKLQSNLVILPEAQALDFLRFCQRNPKPCPVVGIGETGDPSLPLLGKDIDIRTDVSKYRVFRDGAFSEDVLEIVDLWQDDFVTIALGCSFTFENEFVKHGVPVRHMEQGRNVPMFRSNIPLQSAGPFSGNTVVTMRPVPYDQVAAATRISARFPQAHGAPVAIGDPANIGITDIETPDFGDAVELKEGDVPMFWACGVTPQIALQNAKLPLFVTHVPGCMLLTDVDENSETAN